MLLQCIYLKSFQNLFKKNSVRISSDKILKHLLHLLGAPLISPYLDDPDEIINYATDPDILLSLRNLKLILCYQTILR